MIRNFLISAVVIGAGVAQAQTAQETESTELATTTRNAEMLSGWKYPFSLNLGGNVIDQENVIGQQEGQTTIYNFKGAISADYSDKLYEWENDLGVNESISKTPSIDRFVKSADELKLESLGKRFLESINWLGAYAQLRAEAPIFDGYDERPDTTSYTIAKRNGDVETEEGDRLKTTDSFRPLSTKEAVGAVAKLSRHPLANTEVRTGLGAKQNFANGQLLVQDDSSTEDVVEVIELQDTRVVGWELVGQLAGAMPESNLTYKLYAEALFPITYSPESDDDPEKSKLISTEIRAEVAYAFSKWLAFSYTFTSKKDPLLLPKSQVTHSALLTANYQGEIK